MLGLIFVIIFALGGLIEIFIFKAKPTQRERKIRSRIYSLISIFLIFRLGFVGGSAIDLYEPESLYKSVIAATCVSILMCIISYMLLKKVSNLGKEELLSFAAHYGAVSVGTFAAAIGLLESMGIDYSKHVSIWIVCMELPAVMVSIVLLRRGLLMLPQIILKEKTFILLPLSVILGVLLKGDWMHGEIAHWIIEWGFELALLYFLFEMGRHAAERVELIGKNLFLLSFFGVSMPVIGGLIGALVAQWILNLGPGDSLIFTILTSSASYIAAPNAMKSAISIAKNKSEAEKAVSLALAAALGVTLPFNIIVMRLYWRLSLGVNDKLLSLLLMVALLLIFSIASIYQLHKKYSISYIK